MKAEKETKNGLYTKLKVLTTITGAALKGDVFDHP